MKQLPPGWAWTTLSEIADLKGGLTKGKRRRPEDKLRSVPYLRVENVQRGYLNLEQMKLIEATEAEIEDLRLQVGDVLFNEGGDRDKLGRGWVWQDALPECIHQNHVFRARLRAPNLEPKFVSLYGNSEGAQYFNDHGKQTTNLASINLTKLSEFPIPLPPTTEQNRIVAEIERQLTRVAAATQAIVGVRSRIPNLVTAMVRSALGPLWCDSGTSLPHGWRWMEFGETIESLRNGISTKPDHDEGQPILKISAVRPMELRLDERRYLDGFTDYKSYFLQHGDLLFTRYNGNPRLVGVCASVPQMEETVLYPDKLIRARLKPDFHPAFFEIALNYGSSRSWLSSRIRTTAGQCGISGSDLKAMPVPVPPLELQRSIAENITGTVSTLRHLAYELPHIAVRAERFGQAILKKAFEGKLVPQDPNDEPAAALLERIRAARANAPIRPFPRKREVHA